MRFILSLDNVHIPLLLHLLVELLNLACLSFPFTFEQLVVLLAIDEQPADHLAQPRRKERSQHHRRYCPAAKLKAHSIFNLIILIVSALFERFDIENG